LPGTSYELYIDNIEAERLLNTPSGSKITSTPKDYLQYRIIMASSDPGYFPILYNIQAEWSNGYKIEQTDSNTVRLYNYSGQTQELRLDAIVFGADLAEWYTIDDASIEAGDVVASTGEMDEFGVPILRKATGGDDIGLTGAISTNAGQELGIEAENRRLLALSGRIPIKIDPKSPAIRNGDYITASHNVQGLGFKAQPGDIAIARAFASWNPPQIENNEEGVKSNEESITTVMAYVTTPQSTPFLNPEVLGNLIIEKYGDGYYAVTNTVTNRVVKPVTAFSSAMIANLEAGVIKTQDLVANVITVEGDGAKIETPLIETTETKSDIISPLSDTDITVDLTNQVASDSAGFGTLRVLGDVNVAQGLVVQKDATVAGTLYVDDIESEEIDKLQVTSDKLQGEQASQSARIDTLQEIYDSRFKNIEEEQNTKYQQLSTKFDLGALASPTPEDTEEDEIDVVATNLLIDDLKAQYASISALLDSGVLDYSTASISGDLEAELYLDGLVTTSFNAGTGVVSDLLAVPGQAIINNLAVADTLVVRDNLIFTDMSISTLSDTLYLQPAGGSINLAASTLIVRDDGTVEVNGDLTVKGLAKIDQIETGDLNVKGVITANTIKNDFGQLLDIKLATNSALAIYNSIHSDPTASITAEGEATFAGLKLPETSGKATIDSGEQRVEIVSDKLTDKSDVFLSFSDDYAPATKYWITYGPKEDTFTINLDYPVDDPTVVSWIVIN
jgi:hypothetical protein